MAQAALCAHRQPAKQETHQRVRTALGCTPNHSEKMTSIASLTGSQLRTYNTIFQHPVSHNLEWRHVRALLATLGDVAEEPNGNFRATRKGQILVLHPARTKDVAETDELMALRHFLEQSESAPPEMKGSETHWLVVIDHHEARIFRSEMHDAIPQQILPHEPDDFFRHAHNSRDFSRGQEKPDPNSFFEPLARALHAPGRILVFGTGTGTSSEMEQFIAWSKLNHPELAKRIIGGLTVDEHHLSENQLLAKAREFYMSIRGNGA
jgi:hypothetical protein